MVFESEFISSLPPVAQRLPSMPRPVDYVLCNLRKAEHRRQTIKLKPGWLASLKLTGRGLFEAGYRRYYVWAATASENGLPVSQDLIGWW